jgi:hypothetical protein
MYCLVGRRNRISIHYAPSEVDVAPVIYQEAVQILTQQYSIFLLVVFVVSYCLLAGGIEHKILHSNAVQFFVFAVS